MLAEETGWVLYLESPTDLAILRAFARLLEHEAEGLLQRPFVKYIESNLPQRARDHFFGLKEAKDDLAGVAVFDRLTSELQSAGGLTETMWRRREIENYFCTEQVLLAYARHDLPPDNLFGAAESRHREQVMREVIEEVASALRTLNKPDPWSPEIKATDEFLEPVFNKYFQRLGLPLQFRKSEYHLLASLMAPERLDSEVAEKLDTIAATAKKAKPRAE
jgi:hypothetical protein